MNQLIELAIGVLICLLVLLAENIAIRKQRKKQNNKRYD